MTIMSHTQQPEAFAPYAPYNSSSMGNRSPTSTRNGYATLPTGMGASRQQTSRQPQQMDQRAQGIFPMQDTYGILNNISSRSPAQSTMPAEYMADNQSSWNYNGTSATVSGPLPDARGPRAANRRPGIPDVSSDDFSTAQPTFEPTLQPIFEPNSIRASFLKGKANISKSGFVKMNVTKAIYAKLDTSKISVTESNPSQIDFSLPDHPTVNVTRVAPVPALATPGSVSGRERANSNPFDEQYWMPQPDPSTQPAMGLQTPQQAYSSVPYGHMVNNMDQLRPQQTMFQQHEKKDDLIPTAIVIKNIPFNIRKEMLQAIMMKLNLPQPYAFNYHFDQGVFRGLAFANFSSADETRIVIQEMNQLDVNGRKLRVEYKKMLPEHERERIEREKRQKRGQLEEQHRPVPLTHQGSLQSLIAAPAEVTPTRTSPSNMPDLNDGATLDLYVQLRKYKEDPNAREYLPFESSKSPEERRLIHTLAHHLGLYHESMGQAENRCTVVWKEGMQPPSVALNSGAMASVEQMQLQYPGQNKILARAATIDFGEQRTASQNGYGTIGRNGNPSLEIPEDGGHDGLNSANNLRTIRSMADLGRPAIGARTPSPGESSIYANSSLRLNDMGMSSRQDLSAGFQGMSTTPTTPGGGSLHNRPSELSLSGVTNNLSSLSVAETYETTRRENPGAIGSQRPSMNGLNGRNAPERQPRGPESGWETNGGFAVRRANGHAQRGSGSSKLNTSGSYNELLTGSAADSSDNFHNMGSNGLYSQ